ncbi:hypothetical protein CRUP_036446, partial [Coryphaenoides rupestris]
PRYKLISDIRAVTLSQSLPSDIDIDRDGARDRDIQRLGVTLMGHQKKIMTSVQVMRVQVLNRSVPSVHV